MDEAQQLDSAAYDDDLTPADGLPREEMADGTTLYHADAEQVMRRTHTIIGTNVPGLMYVAASGTNGLEVETIDYRSTLAEVEGRPFVTGARQVTTENAFLAELRRRPLDPACSTITAQETERRVVAIYDDHPAGMVTNSYGNRAAGRQLDQLVLQLRFSPDFVDWRSINGMALDFDEFANVLEERLDTIFEPTPGRMIEFIETLRSADHTADLEVPNVEIKFTVPVYVGATVKYPFVGWLRMNEDTNRLMVTFQPANRDMVRRAWNDVLDRITHTVNPGGDDRPEVDLFTILDS